MAEDYSSLGFLVAPDEAQAIAQAQARLKALRRRAPVAGALALTPDQTISSVGRAMLAEPGNLDQQLAQLMEARRREEDRRQQLAMAKQQHADQLNIQRLHLMLQQQAMANGQWTPITGVDPDTGMPAILGMLNHRTGQVQPLGQPPGSPKPGPAPLPASQPPAGPPSLGGMMPSHGAPPQPSGYAPGMPVPRPGGGMGGVLPTLPPMKLSPEMMKVGANIGGTLDAFHTALRVGFPTTGLAGLPQSLGQIASTHGVPALASPAAEQTYAAWYNVIRPLVNIRTGQQMSVQELLREFGSLAPRPGEAPETMLMKVHQLPSLLRRYTVGLPPVYARSLNAEWDQLEREMPRSAADIERMQASGTPGQYAGQPASSLGTGTLGGRRVRQVE